MPSQATSSQGNLLYINLISNNCSFSNGIREKRKPYRPAPGITFPPPGYQAPSSHISSHPLQLLNCSLSVYSSLISTFRVDVQSIHCCCTSITSILGVTYIFFFISNPYFMIFFPFTIYTPFAKPFKALQASTRLRTSTPERLYTSTYSFASDTMSMPVASRSKEK